MNLTLINKEYKLDEKTTFAIGCIGGTPSPYPMCLFTNADVQEVDHKDMYLDGVPRYYIDVIPKKISKDDEPELHIFEVAGELIRKSDDEMALMGEYVVAKNAKIVEARVAEYNKFTNEMLEILRLSFPEVFKDFNDKANEIKISLPKIV